MLLVPNFVTAEEVDHILGLAEAANAWVPSVVWRGGEAQNRTSSSFMLRTAQTPVIASIEKRVAMLAGVAVENVERLNIIRYLPGEIFGEHHDGRDRPKTVFVYLNDVPGGGGHTRFRQLALQVKPMKGCAVMWHNLHVDGTRDERLIHRGVAPDQGIKYGMNCFICKRPRGEHKINAWTSLSTLATRTQHVLDLEKMWEACREPDGDSKGAAVFQISEDPLFLMCPCFLKPDDIDYILTRLPTSDDDWLRREDPKVSNVEYVSIGHLLSDGFGKGIAQMAGSDASLIEDIWIERYQPGMYTSERPAGAGIEYTAIIYLDAAMEHEESACTFFRNYGMQFRAMRGCVLLWRNTFPDGSFDDRLAHSELPTSTCRHILLCHMRAKPQEACNGS